MPNNVSRVEIQQVPMFAKEYCASGVDDLFANVRSHCKRDNKYVSDCAVPKSYKASCKIIMPSHDGTTYVKHLVTLPFAIIMWLLGH